MVNIYSIDLTQTASVAVDSSLDYTVFILENVLKFSHEDKHKATILQIMQGWTQKQILVSSIEQRKSLWKQHFFQSNKGQTVMKTDGGYLAHLVRLTVQAQIGPCWDHHRGKHTQGSH